MDGASKEQLPGTNGEVAGIRHAPGRDFCGMAAHIKSLVACPQGRILDPSLVDPGSTHLQELVRREYAHAVLDGGGGALDAQPRQAAVLACPGTQAHTTNHQ